VTWRAFAVEATEGAIAAVVVPDLRAVVGEDVGLVRATPRAGAATWFIQVFEWTWTTSASRISGSARRAGLERLEELRDMRVTRNAGAALHVDRALASAALRPRTSRNEAACFRFVESPRPARAASSAFAAW
jgi:hypothetical protein